MTSLLVLSAAGVVAQCLPAPGPRGESHRLTSAVICAGVLLLPPASLALLVSLLTVLEWVRHRQRWQSLPESGGLAIGGILAQVVYRELGGEIPASPQGPTAALAAGLAAGAFAVLSQVVTAAIRRIINRVPWRETGLFEPASLLVGLFLGCAGVIAALLWQINPYLVALIVGPLILMHRALDIPNLQELARTDPKTGLYNARHFSRTLQEEIRRASRFDRPLAVIMADLDLLRSVNNTYGHLAGDLVLRGVAEIIRHGLREYDVAARFGGEEFSILLPECDLERGLAVAERLRRRVEEARFVVPSSQQPVRVTLSLGISAFPADGREPYELLHQADLALYSAKRHGRNRCRAASPENVLVDTDGADLELAAAEEPERLAWPSVSSGRIRGAAVGSELPWAG